MALFEYTALDTNGRKLKGVIDAEGSKAARTKLKQKGIFPTYLEESTPKANRVGKNSVKLFNFRRVSLADLSIGTRQLATLVGAGIPLVESLKALSEQLDNQELKRVFSETCDIVNEGSTFAKALAKFPAVFPRLYTNMVASGEASGSLDMVLERLSDLLESQAHLRRKIMTASIYPVLMLSLCLIVVILLLTYVVPEISAIFTEQGHALPLPTQIVISLSDFTKRYWLVVLLGAFLSWTAFTRYSASEKGRRVVDNIKLKIPLIGSLALKTATSQMSRTLGTMLSSGVELLSALSIVKTLVGNVVLEESLGTIIAGVREGKTLAAELRRSGRFPSMLVHLVSVGERTGRLDVMLIKAASNYEAELDTVINGLTRILEPVLILFLAVVVGGILFAVMLPMLEMSSLAM